MKFWIMLNGVQLGPMTEAEVRALPITAETPVWSEGFADWKPARQVEAFAGMFGYNPAGYPPSYSQGAYQSQQQQQPMPNYDMPPMPSTHLVWSILVTIFCCIPFGIVAIVNSAGVESAYNRGNYEEAVRKSKSALNWIITSVIVGFVVGVFQAIYFVSTGLFANL